MITTLAATAIAFLTARGVTIAPQSPALVTINALVPVTVTGPGCAILDTGDTNRTMVYLGPAGSLLIPAGVQATVELLPPCAILHPPVVGMSNPSYVYTQVQVYAGGGTDTNLDGDNGTDADIEWFWHCMGAGCGAGDWDGNGDFGTDADIRAFYATLGGH